jgi:hypothetical protein
MNTTTTAIKILMIMRFTMTLLITMNDNNDNNDTANKIDNNDTANKMDNSKNGYCNNRNHDSIYFYMYLCVVVHIYDPYLHFRTYHCAYILI